MNDVRMQTGSLAALLLAIVAALVPAGGCGKAEKAYFVLNEVELNSSRVHQRATAAGGRRPLRDVRHSRRAVRAQGNRSDARPRSKPPPARSGATSTASPRSVSSALRPLSRHQR